MLTSLWFNLKIDSVWILLLAVLACGCGKSTDTPAEAVLKNGPMHISVSDAAVLDFEDYTQWTGAVSNSDVATHGDHSIAVNASGWTEVTSVPVSSLGATISDTVTLDIMVPDSPLSWGMVYLILESCTLQEWYRQLGYVMLSGMSHGTFETVSFSIPEDFRQKLMGTYDDLVFKVVIYADPGEYLIDNLSMGLVVDGDTDTGLPPVASSTLAIPNATSISDVVVAANGFLSVQDGASIAGSSQKMSCYGTTGVSMGENAAGTGIVSTGPVSLAAGAIINGDIDCAAGVVVDSTASYSGTLNENATFGPVGQVTLNLDLPWPTSSDVLLPPNTSNTVVPDTYNDLFIYDGANATLTSGTYRFHNIEVGTGALLTVDDSTGPVVILVDETIQFNGSVQTVLGTDPQLFVGFAGTQLNIDGVFRGVLFAPNATVTVTAISGENHQGSIFANELTLQSNAQMSFYSFAAWNDLCGNVLTGDCTVGCPEDYTLENGVCINSQTVNCTDNAPANATSTVAQVEITYTTAGGWTTPAECGWTCNTDFDLVGGACINTQMVNCTDNTPANATSTVAQVEITYTTAGGWTAPADCVWTCNTDYELNGGACINSQLVDCTENTPANATSTVAQVEITYTTAGGWTTPAECAWTCNQDYELNGGACINTQMVNCVDNAPANATSTIAQVEITYTTGGGWTTPAECGWTCNTDFDLVGGACINTQMVNCTDNAPANATSTVAQVEITYTTAGGWTAPADCVWTCNTDYELNGGACINSQLVDCVDNAPSNATSTVEQVEIMYTTAGGWTTPAECAWSCDTDYDLVGGACINSQLVDCVDAAPANAASTVAQVEISFTTAGGWTTPVDCAWSCDTDYDLVSGACINSQLVDCVDAAPANATSTVAQVGITYSTAGGWTAPAECAWTCDTDYDLVGGTCVNSQMVNCTDNTPANATSTVAQVEITYTTSGGWTAPAECAWTCDIDYDLVGDACFNSQMVNCTDNTPANATSTVTQVEITYTTSGGWTAPADCVWTCNTDYELNGGACINSQLVDCTENTPANATSTVAQVEITYTTAGGWTTPAECAWTCNIDFDLVGGTCVNSQMVNCTDNTPANATSTVAQVEITYTTAGGWTAPVECVWGCDAGFVQENGECVEPIDYVDAIDNIGNTVIIGSRNANDGQGSAYVLVCEPGGGCTNTELIPSLTGGEEEQAFGYSVSLGEFTDGTLWAAVGAPNEMGDVNGGRVYLYYYNSTWQHVHTIQGSISSCGTDVDIYSDWIAVGCPSATGGQVIAEQYQSGDMSASATILEQSANVAGFGSSVAMGDGYVVAAAHAAGEAYLIRLNSDKTAFVDPMDSLIAPEDPSEYTFGADVSCDGSNIGVTSIGVDPASTPVVSFYHLNDDGSLNQSLEPYSAMFEATGASLSMNGEYAVVGTPDGDGDIGKATVLHMGPDGEWDAFFDANSQLVVLNADDAVAGDLFGYSVSVRNGTIVVSAPGLGSELGLNSGRFYTFELPCDPTTACCDAGTGTIFSEGMACGTVDTQCDPMDVCNAAGSCVVDVTIVGAACGDATDNDCNGADTCDGNGVCLDNLISEGASCGDFTDNDCNGADTCDGMGVCRDNFVTEGTYCGEFVGTECADQSTCDGTGYCLLNWAPDGPIVDSNYVADCLDHVECVAGDVVAVPVAAEDNVVCRNVATECDVVEYCDGIDVNCPTDGGDDSLCINPGPDYCSTDFVVLHLDSTGTCGSDGCVYGGTDESCDADKGCLDGRCLDYAPCANRTCDNPPLSPYCEGDDLVTLVGVCKVPDGRCSYEKQTTNCPNVNGVTCVQGQCYADVVQENRCDPTLGNTCCVDGIIATAETRCSGVDSNPVGDIAYECCDGNDCGLDGACGADAVKIATYNYCDGVNPECPATSTFQFEKREIIEDCAGYAYCSIVDADQPPQCETCDNGCADYLECPFDPNGQFTGQLPVLNTSVVDVTADTSMYKRTKHQWCGSLEELVQFNTACPVGISCDADEYGRMCSIRGESASWLRGTVRDMQGNAIPGVTVAVRGMRDYGSTVTRDDGMFDFVLPAGHFTLSFEKYGYLAAQRDYELLPELSGVVDDVVLLLQPIAADSIIGIDADGAVQTDTYVMDSPTDENVAGYDGRGKRTASIVFDEGVRVSYQMKDGSLKPVSGTLDLFVQEYTATENGPDAMPGDLPPASMYTYAFEANTADALEIGASHIVFDRPVPFYVDNFLDFPPGINVPVGYYDADNGHWVPSKSGRVIQLIEIEINGNTQVVPSLDGISDASGELNFTDAEWAHIADRYADCSANTSPDVQYACSYWRVELTHLSPWDINWGGGPPVCAGAPGTERGTGACTEDNKKIDSLCPDGKQICLANEREISADKECTAHGSTIYCERRSLGESLAVPGAPFALNYDSARTGHIDKFIDIHLIYPYEGLVPPSWSQRCLNEIPGISGPGGQVPFDETTTSVPVSSTPKCLNASVKAIYVKASIAGNTIIHDRYLLENDYRSHEIPMASIIRVPWDGLDALGQPVYGRVLAHVEVGYVYDMVYRNTEDFGDNVNPVTAESNNSGGSGVGAVLKANFGGPVTGDRKDNTVTIWNDSFKRVEGRVFRSSLNLEGWELDIQRKRRRKINGGQRVELGSGGTQYLEGDYTIDALEDPVSGDIPPVYSYCNGSWTSPPDFDVFKNEYYFVGESNGIFKYSPEYGTTKLAGGPYVGVNANGGYDTCSQWASLTGAREDGAMAVDSIAESPSIGVDSSGNVIYPCVLTNRVRIIRADGTIDTIAGTRNGDRGFNGDGDALSAFLAIGGEAEVTVLPDQRVVLYDDGNRRIRLIDYSDIDHPTIATILGNGQSSSNSSSGPFIITANTSDQWNTPLPSIQDLAYYQPENQFDEGELYLAYGPSNPAIGPTWRGLAKWDFRDSTLELMSQPLRYARPIQDTGGCGAMLSANNKPYMHPTSISIANHTLYWMEYGTDWSDIRSAQHSGVGFNVACPEIIGGSSGSCNYATFYDPDGANDCGDGGYAVNAQLSTQSKIRASDGTPSIFQITDPAVREIKLFGYDQEMKLPDFYGTAVHEFDSGGYLRSTLDPMTGISIYEFDYERIVDNSVYPGLPSSVANLLTTVQEVVRPDGVAVEYSIVRGDDEYVIRKGNEEIAWIGVEHPAGDDNAAVMTTFTNREGETYYFEYDEYMRLSRLIEPQQFANLGVSAPAHEFDYTLFGKLTRDRGPDGAEVTIDPNVFASVAKTAHEAGTSYKKRITSRRKNFTPENDTDSENMVLIYGNEKTVVLPSGEINRVEKYDNGIEVTEFANGTTVSVAGKEVDPVWPKYLEYDGYKTVTAVDKVSGEASSLSYSISTEKNATGEFPVSSYEVASTIAWVGPGGAAQSESVSALYEDASSNATGKPRWLHVSPSGSTSYQLMDELGRVVESGFGTGETVPMVYPAVTVDYNSANGQINRMEAVSPTGASRATVLTYHDGTTVSPILGVQSPADYIHTVTAGTLTTEYHYDGAGRVVEQTRPDGTSVIYDYDLNGNLDGLAVYDTQLKVVSSTGMDYFDSNLMSLFMPVALDDVPAPNTQYTYTLDKKVKTIARPGEAATEFIYSGVSDKLQQIAFADGGTVTYSFDEIADFTMFGVDQGATGLLTGMTSSYGVNLEFGYVGELLHKETYSISEGLGTHVVQNDYYNNFRPLTQSVDGAQSVMFMYGVHGLLSSVGGLSLEANGGRDATTGQIQGTSITSGGGTVSSAIGYSADFLEYAGEIMSHDIAGALYDVSYTRDEIGRIATKTETISGVETMEEYTYDSGGRLSDVARSVTDSGVTTTATVLYDYDANGNRLTVDRDGEVWAGVYDAQDRLAEYCLAMLPYQAEDPCSGATTFTEYTYTSAGDLSSKTVVENGLQSERWEYTYASIGNLRQAVKYDSTDTLEFTIDYLIDAMNRRVGRIRTDATGTIVDKKGWLYDGGLNPIAELDDTGNVATRFVYATKSNVPDYMIRNGITYRIASNHLGSPVAVVDVSDGRIAQQISYDEFGVATLVAGSDLIPFGFAGGLYDADTGLLRFGARDYDPEVGRWTAKDPILFNGGDTNLYGYVFGDPVNFNDPRGLSWSTTLTILGGGTAGVAGALAIAGIISGGTALPFILVGAAVVGAVQIWEATHVADPIDRVAPDIERYHNTKLKEMFIIDQLHNNPGKSGEQIEKDWQDACNMRKSNK